MAIGKGEIRTKITMTPNASVAQRAFAEAGVEFGDYRPAWPRAAGVMRQGIVRALQSRGSSIGRVWPRGNSEYLKRKTRAGLGGQQMVRKGRVKTQALTGKPVRMTKKSVSVGFPAGKRFAHLPRLQFKLGYWIVDWDATSRAGVQAAMDAYIQEIFGRVRMKLAQGRAA